MAFGAEVGIPLGRFGFKGLLWAGGTAGWEQLGVTEPGGTGSQRVSRFRRGQWAAEEGT